MKRSAINPMPEYFVRYINLVPDIELLEAFEKSIDVLQDIDRNSLTKLDDKRYAPDKWTVKDILQHIIDAERIFAYRALRFARNDNTRLPGFDENAFAVHTAANDRTIISLLEELIAVRKTTKIMYENFDPAILNKKGIASDKEISVLALGFTIIGHQMHHLQIIDERYIPLIK
jgi:hypothetical protein